MLHTCIVSGFRAAVIGAVKAAEERCKEVNEQLSLSIQ